VIITLVLVVDTMDRVVVVPPVVGGVVDTMDRVVVVPPVVGGVVDTMDRVVTEGGLDVTDETPDTDERDEIGVEEVLVCVPEVDEDGELVVLVGPRTTGGPK